MTSINSAPARTPAPAATTPTSKDAGDIAACVATTIGAGAGTGLVIGGGVGFFAGGVGALPGGVLGAALGAGVGVYATPLCFRPG